MSDPLTDPSSDDEAPLRLDILTISCSASR